jgi:hypothetical protein
MPMVFDHNEFVYLQKKQQKQLLINEISVYVLNKHMLNVYEPSEV